MIVTVASIPVLLFALVIALRRSPAGSLDRYGVQARIDWENNVIALDAYREARPVGHHSRYPEVRSMTPAREPA